MCLTSGYFFSTSRKTLWIQIPWYCIMSILTWKFIVFIFTTYSKDIKAANQIDINIHAKLLFTTKCSIDEIIVVYIIIHLSLFRQTNNWRDSFVHFPFSNIIINTWTKQSRVEPKTVIFSIMNVNDRWSMLSVYNN